MRSVLKLSGVAKSFKLHLQDGTRIDVFDDLELVLRRGEAVGLCGASGAGKSSLLKTIYGTYTATDGRIEVYHDGRWVDLVQANPHQVLQVRRSTIGFVTQFLRVIPRIPCIDIVAEPLIERGARRRPRTSGPANF